MQTLVSGYIMQTLAYCIFRLRHADSGTVCLCFTQTEPYTYVKQRQTVFSGCIMQILVSGCIMQTLAYYVFRLLHADSGTVCLCFTQTETYTHVKQRQTVFSGCIVQTLACQSLHDAT